jgi:hypothetical protein
MLALTVNFNIKTIAISVSTINIQILTIIDLIIAVYSANIILINFVLLKVKIIYYVANLYILYMHS